MKKSTSHSASKLLLFSMVLLSTITSCKKEDVAVQPVIDKEVFFTITIDSNEYTAYGYYDAASIVPYGGPTLAQSTGLNSFGDSTSFIGLESADSYTGGNNSMGSNTISLGNCKLKLSMDKLAPDLLGVYASITGNLPDQSINKNTIEELYFEPTGCILTIERIVKHPSSKAEMVEGHIFCRIYTGTRGYQTFPAVGNFRMYLKK